MALEGTRCKGGCGVGLFAPRRIFLNADLGALGGVRDGASVEVSAAARHLAWRALLVFGTPLAVVLAATLLVETVETIAWPSWLIVAALLGTLAMMLAVRYAWRRPERAPVCGARRGSRAHSHRLNTDAPLAPLAKAAAARVKTR